MSQQRIKTYPPRICEYCGKEFIPHQNTQRFCSKLCAQRERTGVRVLQKTCPECGKVFETLSPQRIHCSQRCRRVHQNIVRQAWREAQRQAALPKEPPMPAKRAPYVMKHPCVCEECGKGFLGKFAHQRFCSVRCRNAAAAKRKRKERLTAEYEGAVDGLVADAQASWGSDPYAAWDNDAMVYGNML